MNKKEAVGILNKFRHRGTDWMIEWDGEVLGVVAGHPETVNHHYLNEFEAIAIAEKYLRDKKHHQMKVLF